MDLKKYFYTQCFWLIVHYLWSYLLFTSGQVFCITIYIISLFFVFLLRSLVNCLPILDCINLFFTLFDLNLLFTSSTWFWFTILELLICAIIYLFLTASYPLILNFISGSIYYFLHRFSSSIKILLRFFLYWYIYYCMSIYACWRWDLISDNKIRIQQKFSRMRIRQKFISRKKSETTRSFQKAEVETKYGNEKERDGYKNQITEKEE